ncbi:MAG: MYXO-CTERM sorting domain-containing protein [Myxococcota bacterium]
MSVEWRCWAVVLAAGILHMVYPAQSQAGVEFIEIQVTTIPVGEGVNPGARILVSDEGDVVLVTVGMDGARLLPVDLGTGASEIVYAYSGQPDVPFVPVSWTFGPGGDILLRGNSVISDQEELGVTARIELDGTVNWEQPDTAFSASAEYLGLYVNATGPVVWSPLAQRVMVFTTASFEVAPVSQASMLFEFNGDVRIPSVVFGDQFVGATLANALPTPDGQYLVYYFAQNDIGARFFVYDGRETVTNLTPEGGDWTQRIVYLVEYDPQGNLILLWNGLDDSSDPTKARLTKITPDGSLAWEINLAGILPDVGPLERPSFMVSADDEIVLLRRSGETFFFDIRDTRDGSPLGFFDFSELTDLAVFDLKFLKTSDRNYLLTTVDVDNPERIELLQVQLTLNDEPVVIEEPQESNGTANNNGTTGLPDSGTGPINADAGTDTGGSNTPDVDAGCGCTSVHTPPSPMYPLGLVLGMIGLGAGVVFRRRLM